MLGGLSLLRFNLTFTPARPLQQGFWNTSIILQIYHYIKRHPDAVVRWLQLTDGDNAGSYYWESLTHNISLDNPNLAAKLREFGFPDTLARFKQFAEILKNAEHCSHKHFSFWMIST